jgi:hypothetical protein
MRIHHLLAAAGLGVAALAIPSIAPAQVGVYVGPPTGPGWNTWHERRMVRRGWYGPAWYNGPGRHHGWYHWRNSYYRNCAWRWNRHHEREWRCW